MKGVLLTNTYLVCEISAGELIETHLSTSLFKKHLLMSLLKRTAGVLVETHRQIVSLPRWQSEHRTVNLLHRQSKSRGIHL